MFETTDFLFTAETTPDVTTDLAGSVGKVENLGLVADAVNVTDSPNCKSRLNSLLVASEIQRSGLDVISIARACLSCRWHQKKCPIDRALQTMLLKLGCVF